MNDAVIYEAAQANAREGCPAYVGILRLNRPDERNPMSAELLDAFLAKVQEVKADTLVRCVVLTGSGSCFSAGANLKGIIQREAPGKSLLPGESSSAMYTSFLSLLEVEVPVVGALNGHTVGGGFGLSLLCDVRIGAKGAKYGANFTRLGLHPGMGTTFTLPHLIGMSRAAEMLYSGELVVGEEAARLGILSRAVEADQVMPEAMKVAYSFASAAPLAVRTTKAALRGDWADQVRAAAKREGFIQSQTVLTSDFQEGKSALLEKRTPNFNGR